MTGRGSVLLVEDELDDVELTLMSFRQWGFTPSVLVARDGQQALDILRGAGSEAVAVVVLDLNMPKLSGIEVLERMRARKELKEMPVVVLTSSDEPRDRASAQRLGVKAYFLKPVMLDDFGPIVERLRSIMAESAAPPV